MLLPLLFAMAGCAGSGRAERVADFGRLYEETTFAADTVGVVPLPRERVGRPPTVVNWFYAGSRGGLHRLVLRTATWDASGEPVTDERRYDVPAEQLLIAEPFAVTGEVARWVPLHEAAAGVAPPPGVDTWRERIEPERADPVEVEVDPGGLPPDLLPPDLPGELPGEE